MKDIENSSIMRDGKSLILAYDHGLEHGPENFDPNPVSADPEHIFKIATHDAVTALALQKGVAESYREWEKEYTEVSDMEKAPLLVKLNGTSNMWSPDSYYSPKNCTVKYAVEELGADAVGFTVYAGSDREAEMFEQFREVQEEARKYDVPVVMWAYPRGKGIEENPDYKGQKDADVIAYAARIGLELGADMVKCKYPGSKQETEKILRNTGDTKFVMSGGSKRSDEDFLKDVKNSLKAGGNGLAVGRNIFQREQPEKILDKLEETIFEK